MINSHERAATVNPILLMSGKTWRVYVSDKASLFDQIESLPENEKLVLALHYYEGLSFPEIGQLLEVTEWEAIILHTQACSKLQMKLEDTH